MDCELTLAHIAQGNKSAFCELYRRFQPEMTRYVFGLLAQDLSIAEDVVNEAFLAIWQQAGNFSGFGSAVGWIRRIVRNKAIDWLRKQREVTFVSDAQASLADEIEDTALSPYQSLERKSKALLVRACLSRLSREHREVIWLCYFEHKSILEIAEISCCPENTVKTRLFHARKALFTILQKEALMIS
jgi:RNA polymerase sigma-70 factor, ECF subfamily